MKKILVPTDFSKTADKALEFAVRSAQEIPIEITLLNSYPSDDNAYTEYVGLNKEFKRKVMNDIQKDLDDLKLEIQAKQKNPVKTILSTQPLIDGIIEETRKNHYDLIAMGTVGASGISEKLFGSNTSEVIGNTIIPLMAIPEDYTWKKPEKFLLAINRFDDNNFLPQYLTEMVTLYGGRLEVIEFRDAENKSTENNTVAESKTAYIQNLEGLLKKEIVVNRLSGSNFQESLQQYINDNGFDVLVMVTYQQKKNFWDRIFNPSQTKKMSYHTNIPLLAIPGKTENG